MVHRPFPLQWGLARDYTRFDLIQSVDDVDVAAAAAAAGSSPPVRRARVGHLRRRLLLGQTVGAGGLSCRIRAIDF